MRGCASRTSQPGGTTCFVCAPASRRARVVHVARSLATPLARADLRHRRRLARSPYQRAPSGPSTIGTRPSAGARSAASATPCPPLGRRPPARPRHAARRPHQHGGRHQRTRAGRGRERRPERPARGHAFLWQDGQMTRSRRGASESCYAFDINDRGDVAGACDRDAIVWSAPRPAPPAPPRRLHLGSRRGHQRRRRRRGTVQVTFEQPALPSAGGRRARAAAAAAGRDPAPSTRSTPAASSSATSTRPPATSRYSGTTTCRVRSPARWGGFQGYAWDVNDRDEIAIQAGRRRRSATAATSGATACSTARGNGSRHGLNNRGVVVGYVYEESGLLHGAVWPKALTRIPPDQSPPRRDAAPQAVFLGTLGGAQQRTPRASTLVGQIPGYSTVARRIATRFASLSCWSNGAMRDLQRATPARLSLR